MKLIHDLEVLQVCASENVSDAAINAADFCGRLAKDLGATVYISKSFPGNRSRFYQYDKCEAAQIDLESALSWAMEETNRLLLVVGGEHPDKRLENTSVSFVEVVMAPWHSEATLFAESGIAHLLGDPERAPICPAGNFAAGTIGYAAFCALVGVYLKKERLGKSDSATVLGPSAMSWVNWKAAAGGVTGREMKREGNQGLWPTLACKDGYAALVYNQKDWPNIIKMVDDERLADPKYADFTERSDCADEWLGILRDWAKQRTKDELNALFFDHAIPSAAVLTPSDLLSDALMQHRDAFKIRELDNGEEQHLAQPSHRFVQSIKAENTSRKVQTSQDRFRSAAYASSTLASLQRALARVRSSRIWVPRCSKLNRKPIRTPSAFGPGRTTPRCSNSTTEINLVSTSTSKQSQVRRSS